MGFTFMIFYYFIVIICFGIDFAGLE